MGFIDDAKETLDAAGQKVKKEFDEFKDRVDDKVDEAKADASVKKAKAEKESVEKRNEVKESLRD